MTKAQLQERLEVIKEHDFNGNHLTASLLEKHLWEDFLRAIAAGQAEDPKTMAFMCVSWYEFSERKF